MKSPNSNIVFWLERFMSPFRRHCRDLLGISVAGFLMLLYFCSPGRIIEIDVGVREAMSKLLWTQGTVFVEEGDGNVGMIYNPSKKAWTSYYGIGQMLLFIPFSMLGTVISLLAKATGKMKPLIESLPLVFLYVPLIGLLWWWTMVRVFQEFGISRNKAAGAALMFYFSTILWIYASQSAQEEAVVGTMALAAFLFGLSWSKNPNAKHAFLLGLLSAATVLFRLNSIFIFLPLMGLLMDGLYHGKIGLQKCGRYAGLALLGALIPMIIHCMGAYWRFGSPFSTGYDLNSANGNPVHWTSINWTVFFGLLFGGGKGMFVLSPPLILSLVGIPVLWKRQPFLWSAVVIAIIGSALFHAMIQNNPDGSECWGARYQVHLIGFLAYPTIVGIQTCFKTGSLMKCISIILIIFGIGIQFAGTAMPNSIEYIQSDLSNNVRYDLITHFQDGHLFRRIQNTITWVSGRSLASESIKKFNAGFSTMEEFYIPNHWGPVYAKRLPGLRYFILFFWVGLGMMGGVLIFFVGYISLTTKKWDMSEAFMKEAA